MLKFIVKLVNLFAIEYRFISFEMMLSVQVPTNSYLCRVYTKFLKVDEYYVSIKKKKWKGKELNNQFSSNWNEQKRLKRWKGFIRFNAFVTIHPLQHQQEQHQQHQQQKIKHLHAMNISEYTWNIWCKIYSILYTHTQTYTDIYIYTIPFSLASFLLLFNLTVFMLSKLDLSGSLEILTRWLCCRCLHIQVIIPSKLG